VVCRADGAVRCACGAVRVRCDVVCGAAAVAMDASTD
jgi:hypothetical protein